MGWKWTRDGERLQTSVVTVCFLDALEQRYRVQHVDIAPSVVLSAGVVSVTWGIGIRADHSDARDRAGLCGQGSHTTRIRRLVLQEDRRFMRESTRDFVVVNPRVGCVCI